MAAKKKTIQAEEPRTEQVEAIEQEGHEKKQQLKATGGTVKGGALNVRKEPERTAQIVRVLKDGEVVEILEAAGEWYRIADGYIRAEYVKAK